MPVPRRAARTSCRTPHTDGSRTYAAAHCAAPRPQFQPGSPADWRLGRRPCSSRRCAAWSCRPQATKRTQELDTSSLVDDVPRDHGVAHAAGELIAEERRVLTLALQRFGGNAHGRLRIEDDEIARCACCNAP